MSTESPPRFLVRKCTVDMLGTTLNELPDNYIAECHHQEGNSWVIVAERAPEQLSVEMVGEPLLRPHDVLVEAGISGASAPGGPVRSVENPEPDYDTEAFDAVWSVIRRWDIERLPGKGSSGANGTDVQVILDALRPFFRDGVLAEFRGN